MPSKGVYKTFINDTFYHLFNRGNNRQDIFLDKQDYLVFLRYLWNQVDKYKNPKIFPAPEIEIHAFCLMPNHFHLLVKQKSKDTISSFMRSFMTQYTIYFNKRHSRIGGLYQSRYKAKIVDTDEYLLHLSRYIHSNPGKKWANKLAKYPYSSYSHYLNPHLYSPVTRDFILNFFNTTTNKHLKSFNSYQSFVENYPDDQIDTINPLEDF